MRQLEGLPLQMSLRSQDFLGWISSTTAKPILQQIPEGHEGGSGRSQEYVLHVRGDHSWCDRRPPEDAVWRTGWRCGWRLLVPLPIGWDSSYWLVIPSWTYFAATHWWVYVVMPWWSTEPLSVCAWSACDAWELHALLGRVVTRVHMRNYTRVFHAWSAWGIHAREMLRYMRTVLHAVKDEVYYRSSWRQVRHCTHKTT